MNPAKSVVEDFELARVITDDDKTPWEPGKHTAVDSSFGCDFYMTSFFDPQFVKMLLPVFFVSKFFYGVFG
jgi:hypothetical protein